MNSNIIQMPRREDAQFNRIYDEAVEWLVELDAGMEQTRLLELKQWLAKSADNESIFLEQAKLWDELEVLSQLADILPYDSIKPQAGNRSFYAIAASLFICVLFAGYVSINYWQPTPVTADVASPLLTKSSYATQVGEFKQYILPDGSVLTLNTDTQASIEFDDEYRNIILSQGELHIEVAHEPNRPLNIIVGDNIIQAVGTAFNVQYVNQHDVELIVSEGKVLLAHDELLKQKINFSQQSLNRSDALLLSAGQKVSFIKGNPIRKADLLVEDVSAQININLSWLKGALIFSGEPMYKAIEKVNRYLEQPIHLQGDSIKNLRVIGRYEQGKLDQFLLALEANFNINKVQNSQGQIVLSMNQ
ncbi:FecR domain-containing protein [Alteromonadaceae bacterium BrNp21-10]|nr:FecR domain-containing protein [Alteromonadaceae bacterium BrNp21-10]